MDQGKYIISEHATSRKMGTCTKRGLTVMMMTTMTTRMVVWDIVTSFTAKNVELIGIHTTRDVVVTVAVGVVCRIFIASKGKDTLRVVLIVIVNNFGKQ